MTAGRPGVAVVGTGTGTGTGTGRGRHRLVEPGGWWWVWDYFLLGRAAG
jgi:hypothetical protein